MPGHHQTHRKEEHLHDLLGHRVQRISQDALERHAAFFYRGDNTDESGFGQHDTGRGLGDIGRGGHRDSHLRLAQRRRVVGAVAAHADGMTAVLKRLDQLVLVLRQHAGENRKLLGAHLRGDGPGRADFSVHANIVRDDGRGRRRVAGHHDRAHPQRVQFRNQRG